MILMSLEKAYANLLVLEESANDIIIGYETLAHDMRDQITTSGEHLVKTGNQNLWISINHWYYSCHFSHCHCSLFIKPHFASCKSTKNLYGSYY